MFYILTFLKVLKYYKQMLSINCQNFAVVFKCDCNLKLNKNNIYVETFLIEERAMYIFLIDIFIYLFFNECVSDKLHNNAHDRGFPIPF